MILRVARSGDEGAIARVHVDSWWATYQSLLNSVFLDSLRYEDREALWRRVLASGWNL